MMHRSPAVTRTLPLPRRIAGPARLAAATTTVISSSSSSSSSCSSSRCFSTSAPPSARRPYATQSPGPPPRPQPQGQYQVFDARAKWLQKERAATRDAARGREAEYLRDEVAARLCERLLDIRRTWPLVLDLGAHACNVARALVRPDPDPGLPASEPVSARVGRLVAAESSPALLYRDADLPLYRGPAGSGSGSGGDGRRGRGGGGGGGEGEGEVEGPTTTTTTTTMPGTLDLVREVLASGETLPWPADTFDLVLSSLSLHWTNDLPGVLAQINRVLRPDCAFVGAMLGGDTLFELRTSLQLAEQERRGGVAPRVSPLADVRDVGGLLQRAGFRMLTVDVDDLVVSYPDVFALMQDLQAMGEANAVLGREPGPIGRDVLLAADAIYRALHGSPGGDDDDGSIPATFRTIYMIGWKAGEDQPRPLPRGSGQVSLKDVLEQNK